ncbi:hypothetical protein [Clostridium botulinum]|uniref:hypothetical protein n=1 Tax=Clostridium botulinum TaxID=1491 RepID=UPI00174EABF2|nr:hypothetical protein [Clostridium botulinum]MBD5589370.1 hypothetical protein [Clostridium botulinum]
MKRFLIAEEYFVEGCLANFKWCDTLQEVKDEIAKLKMDNEITDESEWYDDINNRIRTKTYYISHNAFIVMEFY